MNKDDILSNWSSTRRSFLRTSAMTTAGLVTYQSNRAFAAQQPRIHKIDNLPLSDTFPLGIASGDVTADSAIIWTYYEGLLTLQLFVWEAGSSDAVVNQIVHREDGGFVHVDIESLNSQTKYSYAFVEFTPDKQPVRRSQIGTFKTAPQKGIAVPFKIGACSCTFNAFNASILEHAATQNDLDMFLLLGDTTYNDGCSSLAQFRGRWASSLSRKGYLNLRASSHIIATLDDHEFSDNFNPEEIDSAVLEAGRRAFFEHQPIRRRSTNPNQIWRSFNFGATLDIFVLDCRTERLPSTREKEAEQYISKEQMNWLKNSLSQSKAAFKLIMNSVPITDFPFPHDKDRWEGYPIQRKEILSFIDNEPIKGVIWLAGDFHFASVGRVAKEGLGANQMEILAGPGAQVPNVLGLGLNASSQFDWASIRNNYVTLSLDPYKMNVELVYQAASQEPLKNHIQLVEPAFKKVYCLG